MTDPTTLDLDLARLRGFVARTFADEGRPPSIREAARVLRSSVGAVRADLAELHARHLLVLSADRDAIRMAHPFSAAPMGFVVRSGDSRWWGGCTWDSFGISAALALDVSIETTCPHCLAEHRFEAGPGYPPTPPLVARVPRPARSWWDDVIWTCTRIRTFCSEDHARRFAADQGEPPGQVVPLATLWRLAGPWYGDRLDPDYAPRPTAASQAILASVGLDGDFWELPRG
jgi:hypothetical protein